MYAINININPQYVSVFTTHEAIKNQQGAKDRSCIMFIPDILFRATNVSFKRVKICQDTMTFSAHTIPCLTWSFQHIIHTLAFKWPTLTHANAH